MDFLRVGGGEIDLIEAKWTEDPDARWKRVLGDVASVLDASKTQRVGAKAIVCRVPLPRREEDVFITDPGRMGFRD